MNKKILATIILGVFFISLSYAGITSNRTITIEKDVGVDNFTIGECDIVGGLCMADVKGEGFKVTAIIPTGYCIGEHIGAYPNCKDKELYDNATRNQMILDYAKNEMQRDRVAPSYDKGSDEMIVDVQVSAIGVGK